MAYRIWHIANCQKQIGLLVIVYCLLVSLSGCATIMEGAKGIVGVSTKVLEDNRKNAITKTFNRDYKTCYNKTKKILVNISSYIYAQSIKKQMFAIYLSEEDTTPVGIFFKVVDANNTQIEISSPSIYAKESIAGKLFPALEKSLKLEEEKGQTDAKQEMGNK